MQYCRPIDARGFKCGNITIEVDAICQHASIVVNTMPRAEYAAHKLLVYGERLLEMRKKVSKDLEQSATLTGHWRGNDARVAQRLAQPGLTRQGLSWAKI